MNEFSFRRAWAHGIRFFAGRAAGHAALLIGMGVLLPVLLNLVQMWTMGWGADAFAEAEAANSGMGLIVTAAGFVLQTAGLFASWRLGLARGESLRGALLFGLVVGLMTSVGVGLALVAVGMVFSTITPLVAAAAVLVAFVGLFAIVWTAYSALFAVGTCLMFLFALAAGATIGDMTFAATVVGGSGFVWTLLVAASFVLVWLAARLSCTAVLMAERKSFNVWGAMRESWSLTWDDEWRIARYLALLGLVMALGLVAILVLARLAITSMMVGASMQAIALVSGTLLFILYIPLVYIAVMVPVGIYRALAPADVQAAEIFV
jgi:hypothetical protein